MRREHADYDRSIRVSSLEGRVAVVTGAARDRSIGGGIARVLAQHGADVVVNDLAVRTRASGGSRRSRRSGAAPR